MKYSGGKGQTFQKLINLMPPHEVYIETHLGGGSVIRNKRPAKRNIGIEIDSKVMHMWPEEEKRSDMELIQADAGEYLKRYRFTGKEMVYCDPPYLRETRRNNRKYYRYEYTVEQHVEFLEIIKAIPCMVMISGYESELYNEVLKGWNIDTFEAAVRGGVTTEWVWMNYSTPIKLHDYRYLGNNFRERERIKKRKENWISKFKSIPVLERQDLLCAMQSVNGNIKDERFESNS